MLRVTLLHVVIEFKCFIKHLRCPGHVIWTCADSAEDVEEHHPSAVFSVVSLGLVPHGGRLQPDLTEVTAPPLTLDPGEPLKMTLVL